MGDRTTPERHRRGLGGTIIAVGAVALAVFAGTQVVGARDGVSIFGSRTIQVQPGQTSVDVGMMFGSVKIVVPDGTHASTAGTVIFGSMQCEQACSVPGPSEVAVTAHGAFGSVQVVRPNEVLRGNDRDN